MQPIGSISTAQLYREREAWHRFQKKQFQSTSLRDMGSIMIMPEENVSPFHLASVLSKAAAKHAAAQQSPLRLSARLSVPESLAEKANRIFSCSSNTERNSLWQPGCSFCGGTVRMFQKIPSNTPNHTLAGWQ